jgi:hypothetical protein
MRFQINGQGWPLDGGAWLAPPGTVIDASATDHWSLRARGKVISLNATPLDAEATAALAAEVARVQRGGI